LRNVLTSVEESYMVADMNIEMVTIKVERGTMEPNIEVCIMVNTEENIMVLLTLFLAYSCSFLWLHTFVLSDASCVLLNVLLTSRLSKQVLKTWMTKRRLLLSTKLLSLRTRSARK
jgi:hypothetical protein